MDPDATLLALLTAAREGDREAYDEAADALFGWLRAGGFLPRALSDLIASLPQPALFDIT